jgi:hypothetical protein
MAQVGGVLPTGAKGRVSRLSSQVPCHQGNLDSLSSQQSLRCCGLNCAPQNSPMLKLKPQCTILGDGTFGR